MPPPGNPILGDPALRAYYGRARGLVAFIDESYRQPGPTGPGFYTATAALIDRDKMPAVRRALLTVTGGRAWHTNEAFETTPDLIGRMTAVIAEHADNNTLVVTTPWESGTSAVQRALCLRTLIPEVARQGCRLIVLDGLDEPGERRDLNLVRELRSRGTIGRDVVGVHSDDARESLLWVPDTVGWGFQRLVRANEPQWTNDLVDVVAVKEHERGGWVDLSALREAAGTGGARPELDAQVAKIRAAAFPAGRAGAPSAPARPAQRPGREPRGFGR